MSMLHRVGGAVVPVILLSALPVAADAASVSAKTAVARPCHKGVASASSGRDVTRVKAPARGLVRVRLAGSGGDWDIGVFGRRGRRVAGSAGFGSNELAEGFVKKGERLVIQACRYRGSARSARLKVRFIRLKKASKRKQWVQVVDVNTRTRAAKRRLQSLNLDLTEHGDSNSIEVVLHGRRDARKLRRAGFTYKVRIADPSAGARERPQGQALRPRGRGGARLPSRRDTYRRLPDYELELKQLAMRYPSLVKPITLSNKSVLGRDISGIEITTNPANTADGKPVFLMMGVHHAREWPSSEHSMEFAYDLLRNYGRSRASSGWCRRPA